MKKLLATGIVLSLIGSNLVICHQYLRDSKEYESKINHQNKIIKQYKTNMEIKSDYIRSNGWEIKVLNEQKQQLQNEVNQIKKKLNNVDNEKRKLNMIATYYTSDCEGCSGTTKTGINVSDTIYYKGLRIIAVDPNLIKLHSIVKVETKTQSFYAYAADTGSAIKNNVIDVLVSNEKEAFQLGREKVLITILREGKG
jgi:3D (Asp-Asp-Asp) domain-containing protein